MRSDPTLDRLCIDTIRTLSMDAVQKANSGHAGAPMALAPVAYQLWQRHLRYDPDEPLWPNRDRFVLSVGHASMLLYSVLHLADVKAVDDRGCATTDPAARTTCPRAAAATASALRTRANACACSTAISRALRSAHARRAELW